MSTTPRTMASKHRKFSPRKISRAQLRISLAAAAIVCVLGAAANQRARAQHVTAPTPIAPTGDVILLLGTHGGPELTEARSEPATLLIVDGRRYLIDCGIGTMRRLLDAGVPSQTIGTIFITHNHPDHALGLVDVLANDYHYLDLVAPGSNQKFNIYGPPQTPALVRAAYNFITIPYAIFAAEPVGRSALSDPFKAHAIDHNGVVYHDNKIRVIAAENTHYQLMPAKSRASMKSYSYRFETPYGAIVFTGDTGPSPAVEHLAKGADVLITEVEDLTAIVNSVRQLGKAGNVNALVEHMRMEHLTMREVGEMATRAQVKSVILYHFVGGMDGPRFVSGVKKYYSGPVYAGEDLARYCLGTSNGSGAHQLTPCR